MFYGDNMNLKLKFRIMEIYGSQADFAQIVGEDETLVSRVIRGRRTLSPVKKEMWARKLRSSVKTLFGEE